MAPYSSWDIFPRSGKDSFQAMRSEKGEEMLLKNNFFVGKSGYILSIYQVPNKNHDSSRAHSSLVGTGPLASALLSLASPGNPTIVLATDWPFGFSCVYLSIH